MCSGMSPENTLQSKSTVCCNGPSFKWSLAIFGGREVATNLITDDGRADSRDHIRIEKSDSSTTKLNRRIPNTIEIYLDGTVKGTGVHFTLTHWGLFQYSLI